jgi:hypothetical protein
MRMRFVPVTLLGLASCNGSQQPEPAVAVAAASRSEAAPAPKAEPQAPPPAAKPAPPQTPPAPPLPAEFAFPKDEAGKLLPKVVTPPSPPAPPVEKFGTAPKPRIASTKVTDPDPLPKLAHTAPPLLPAKLGTAKPTSPAERVPLDIGLGAHAVPQRPVFAEAPGIALRSRDVSLPPDLLPTAKPVADRVSLDDPTADVGNAVITANSPTPVLGQAGFLKVTLPDPFELGEQVKPKIAPAAEPSTAPVVVNPQRPK